MSARLLDSIFQPTEISAGISPALNLNYGGMTGASPRYGHLQDGKHYAEWISGTPYMQENVIPVLLSYPKFMDWLPNKDLWIGQLKAAIEVEALSIDGLRSTRTVNTEGTPNGGAGEEFEVANNVTIERSVPSFTWKERMGRPFTKLFKFWIEYGLMDPHTKRAKVLKFLKNPTSNEEFIMYTPDFYTMTVLFIEPGNQFTTVEKAWLCFNMFPKSSGPIEGKRDITAPKSLLDVNIEFTAMTLDTDAVVVLAKNIMPRLKSLYEIPDIDMTLPIADMDPSVKDNKTAHSFEGEQGNGEFSWDTYPAAQR